MSYTFSKRLRFLPHSQNQRMDKAYSVAMANFSKESIAANSLTIGDPSVSPPDGVMEVFARCSAMKDKQGYVLPASGKPALLESASAFFARKLEIDQLSPSAYSALKGARKGLNDIVEAFTDEGDLVALPAWHYPGCLNAAVKGYTKPIPYSVQPNTNLCTEVVNTCEQAKHEFGKYPRLVMVCPVGNPFCRATKYSELQELVEYLAPKKIPILSDEAYVFNPFPGEETISLMQVPGGREAGISLPTFSKLFDAPSWRLAFAQSNNMAMMDAVRRIDSAGTYGHSYAVEQAAIEAMKGCYDHFSTERGAEYYNCFKIVSRIFANSNTEVLMAQAGMFAALILPPKWAAIGSVETAARFLEHKGKRINPGRIHGQDGDADGLLRLALVKDEPVVAEVARDLCAFLSADPEQYEVPPDAQSSYIA